MFVFEDFRVQCFGVSVSPLQCPLMLLKRLVYGFDKVLFTGFGCCSFWVSPLASTTRCAMWFGVSGTRNKGYPSITLILGIKFWNSGFRLSDGWGGGGGYCPKP